MNEVLTVISFIVGTCSILALLLFIVFYIKGILIKCAFIKKDTELNKTMASIDDTIKSCVCATNRIMVDRLKTAEGFYQLDKEECFVFCKERITKILKDSDVRLVETEVGNVTTWINNRIEYYVKFYKNNSR